MIWIFKKIFTPNTVYFFKFFSTFLKVMDIKKLNKNCKDIFQKKLLELQTYNESSITTKLNESNYLCFLSAFSPRQSYAWYSAKWRCSFGNLKNERYAWVMRENSAFASRKGGGWFVQRTSVFLGWGKTHFLHFCLLYNVCFRITHFSTQQTLTTYLCLCF